MKRVRGLEKDDIRICVSELIEIEKRQDAERMKIEGASVPAGLCAHELWDYLNCEECAEMEIECSGRICLDCSEVWEED